jgi:hypothetical protein
MPYRWDLLLWGGSFAFLTWPVGAAEPDRPLPRPGAIVVDKDRGEIIL